MMIRRVPRWLLVVGIVSAASACDNVSFEGFHLSLEGPAQDSALAVQDTTLQPPPQDPAATLGPLLYAGKRAGNRAWVFPVAEITGEGLQPLPEGARGEELTTQILQGRLRIGGELALFHQNRRVGTLVVDQTEVVSEEYCQPRPRGSGLLLLLPEANDAQNFLALEPARAGGIPFGVSEDLSSTYDQRVASLNLGREAVPLTGAPWPPSLLDIRQDLQILDLPGMEGPAVMATFVHLDQIQVGPAPEDAYSLLVLGEPRGSQFDLTYAWYRPVGTQGKGVPRYFSRLDWDRDGDDEILLEVLGSQSRWFVGLDRGSEGWETIYQDPCGTPDALGGGG